MNGEAIGIETDNIFEELGVPDAENLKRRVFLGCRIQEELARQGLDVAAGAQALRATQDEASALMNADFADLSLERLIDFCERLGFTVTLDVRPPREPAPSR